MTTSPAPAGRPGTLTEIAAMYVASEAPRLTQYVEALGRAADAPPEVLRELAEEDARLCAGCGGRIYRWQPVFDVSFDPDLPCCSSDCRERVEDERAESVREQCEERSAEAAREAAGGWPR